MYERNYEPKYELTIGKPIPIPDKAQQQKVEAQEKTLIVVLMSVIALMIVGGGYAIMTFMIASEPDLVELATSTSSLRNTTIAYTQHSYEAQAMEGYCYDIRDDQVFYISLEDESHTFFPVDANPSKFEELGNCWGRDTQSVFYHGEIQKNIDPNGVVIFEHYIKTSNGVWALVGNLGFAEIDADSGTFTQFANGYALDRDKVYYYGLALDGADPSSIVLLRETSPEEERDARHSVFIFSKDNDQVFYRNEPIPGADPYTFEVVEPPAYTDEFIQSDAWYSKDKQHVYFQNRVVDGVDSTVCTTETFAQCAGSGV